MTHFSERSPALYSRSDLMRLLRYRDKDSFRKKLAELMARHFFPSPLPGLPNKWSAKEVDAWLAGYRPPQQARQPASSGTQQTGCASRLQSRLAARRFTVVTGGLDKAPE
jgi:hypothetical protein